MERTHSNPPARLALALILSVAAIGCDSTAVVAPPDDGGVAVADAAPGATDGGRPPWRRDGSVPDGGRPERDAGAAPLPTQPPLYLLLFAHTEDPFNHARSEERYERIVPILERLDREHPEANLSWLVQLQGSDARTVWERNPSTGVADLLRRAADEGVVHFGYHGWHDPTYLSKPTRLLNARSTFAEMSSAVDDWITCHRDLSSGACVEPGAGGVLEIEAHFGPVEVVSGLGLGAQGVPVEMGPGRYAVRQHLPEQIVGFGLPDHGGLVTPTFTAAVEELMGTLTPGDRSSRSAFWANGGIKLNGASWVASTTINAQDGPDALDAALAGIDRSRPHIMNLGLGTKYLYTSPRWSPTVYGYANPDAPELPPEGLQSDAQIEQNYRDVEATLEHLVADLVGDERAIYIVTPADIAEHVAPPTRWEVTRDELASIAQDLVDRWGAEPPSYASDGEEYYSLRDAMGLLAVAITDGGDASLRVPTWYGPFEAAPSAGALSVARASVRDLASRVAAEVRATSPTRQPTPPNLMSSSYLVDGRSLNAAQALHALAREYLAEREATAPSSIDVPSTEPTPATLAPLTTLHCLDCVGTAWSLSPAVIR